MRSLKPAQEADVTVTLTAAGLRAVYMEVSSLLASAICRLVLVCIAPLFRFGEAWLGNSTIASSNRKQCLHACIATNVEGPRLNTEQFEARPGSQPTHTPYQRSLSRRAYIYIYICLYIRTVSASQQPCLPLLELVNPSPPFRACLLRLLVAALFPQD